MLLDTPPVGAVPVMVSAEVEEAEACIHHSRPWTDKVGVGVPVDEADTENDRPRSTPTGSIANGRRKRAKVLSGAFIFFRSAS